MIAAAAALAGLSGLACAAGSAPDRATASRPRPPTGVHSSTGKVRSTAIALPPLSLQQLAGQRVIFSYPGLTPPASLLAAIRAGHAAGVILFAANVSTAAHTRAIIQALQAAAAQSPVKQPLLIMTDQEGGLVRRLSGSPSLSEKQIGASPQRQLAASAAGRAAALNLQGAGINVNLAPVLDVYRTQGNFIDQFERSYSSNPRTVATLGADFITAQQGAGVAATAKHFPGLGSAARAQNTDLVPVTLRASLGSLRAVDELPYHAAIAANVELVMVSWATYPALDPTRPAGLSPAIVQGELRDRLEFPGVTVTDALAAGALTHFGGTARRAVLAAGAGMDLLLCASQDVDEGEQAVSALANALRTGQLPRSAFGASVQRVVALRSSLRSAR
jgi:beta-N-acetylhexosaminidase